MGNIQPTGLIKEFKKGRLIKVGNHELIMRAGETPKGVFYLAGGFIKVYSITSHGIENLHIIYKKDDIFPLIWAYKDSIRSVFYESLGASRLYILPKSDFLELSRTSLDFNRQIMDRMVDQFQVYADRLDNLQYNNATERLVYRLLFLAGRFGRRSGKSILIDAPITHQHIADSINLARETVSREIEKLQHQGLISHERRMLVLNDVSKLEAVTGEPPSSNLWGLK